MQNGTMIPLTQQAGIDWQASFTQTVLGLAERAKASLPKSHSRIDKAVDIVLNRDIVPSPDGRYVVGSQSDCGTYLVYGSECNCPDYPQAPEHWCQHRLAASLWYQATAAVQERQAAHTNGSATGHHPVPRAPQVTAATPEPGLPEAPASVNCFIEVAGRQAQITLRDTDETRLLERLARVLTQYPLAEQPAQPAVIPAPQPAPPPVPLCPMHQVPMKRHSKHGETWHSHKLPDGSWCRGK